MLTMRVADLDGRTGGRGLAHAGLVDGEHAELVLTVLHQVRDVDLRRRAQHLDNTETVKD